MTKKAIIVGGGPAGAFLAYLIASRNVDVTLIERHSDFAREFRGEGLTPGGQKMFREAGLWDEFEGLPHRSFNSGKFFYKGRLFIDQDFDFDEDVFPRWVSQPLMLEMLVDKASGFPNFTFRRGDRVTGLHFEASGRVAGVTLKGEFGEALLEGDYVFACDGRYSTLRKEAGLDQPRAPYAFDIVWCKVPMPGFFSPSHVRAYIGNGQLGLFIPSYDDRLQIGWIIKKGSYQDFRKKGIEGWMEEMAHHVSNDMAGHLRANIKNTSHPFLLDVVCDCYERWAVPGLTLVGDAAHPMSPVGGQGINIALRDSVVVANHFIPLFLDGAGGEALDEAARNFHRERLHEVTTIQEAQHSAPKIILAHGRLMDISISVVRLLDKTGLLRHLVSVIGGQQGRVFIHGVSDVRLSV